MFTISSRLVAIATIIAALTSRVLESERAIGTEPKPPVAALIKAKPFTEVNSFTDGIEGPACDFDGNVYA